MKSKKPIFDAEGYQTNLTDLNGTPLPDLKTVKTIEPTFAFWDNPEDAVYDKLQNDEPESK